MPKNPANVLYNIKKVHWKKSLKYYIRNRPSSVFHILLMLNIHVYFYKIFTVAFWIQFVCPYFHVKPYDFWKKMNAKNLHKNSGIHFGVHVGKNLKTLEFLCINYFSDVNFSSNFINFLSFMKKEYYSFCNLYSTIM